jgi:hypothetical protein
MAKGIPPVKDFFSEVAEVLTPVGINPQMLGSGTGFENEPQCLSPDATCEAG